MNEERFNDEVKDLMRDAQQQAVMNYNQELSTVHFLAAMCEQRDGFFPYLLKNLNVDTNAFNSEVKGLIKSIPSVKGTDRLSMSMGLARVFGLAEQAAGQGEINVSHLLGAMAGDGDTEVIEMSKKYGNTKREVVSLYAKY